MRPWIQGRPLGLFWYHSPNAEGPFYQATDTVWREVAPQLFAGTQTRSSQDLIDLTVLDIDGSGLYGSVTIRRYHWKQVYSAQQYVQLLRTCSSVRSLPVQLQRKALGRIEGLINEMGGLVERPYTALLYVAKTQKTGPA